MIRLMSTKDVNEKETVAWEEVVSRTNFLAEVFGRADVATVRMASEKLSEALSNHLPLYEARTKSKLLG